jgi:hypothetical protein
VGAFGFDTDSGDNVGVNPVDTFGIDEIGDDCDEVIGRPVAVVVAIFLFNVIKYIFKLS